MTSYDVTAPTPHGLGPAAPLLVALSFGHSAIFYYTTAVTTRAARWKQAGRPLQGTPSLCHPRNPFSRARFEDPLVRDIGRARRLRTVPAPITRTRVESAQCSETLTPPPPPLPPYNPFSRARFEDPSTLATLDALVVGADADELSRACSTELGKRTSLQARGSHNIRWHS